MEYPDELYKNNYACKFRHGSIHLGFMLNTSLYEGLGFDCNDKDYVSVFTFEEEGACFLEEDPYSNSKLPKYAVFFLCGDDWSYGLRFNSREDRDRFIEDHPVFTEFIRTKCLCWN